MKMKYLIIILALTGCSDNSENVILRSKLDQAIKDKDYYKKQYLKANTQLIEVKQKCIYCAD